MVEILNENIFVQNQDGNVDKILLWLLNEVSGQQNLLLMDDFSYPDTWGKQHGSAQVIHQIPGTH